MEEYCKNCGAPLREDSKFCQDCGSKVEIQQPIDEEINFCPNCGKELEDDAYFCEHCGANLANPLPKSNSEDFIEKYKIPIIVGGIIIFLIIVGIFVLGSSNTGSSQIELPAQTVTVGAEYFEIPGRFHTSPTSFDIDTQGGVVSFSQSWSDDTDSFNIAILSGGAYNVDLESVVASEGGVHKNLMGYDGYYNEIDVGDYSFAFVLDDKICVVEASSPYIFDEIKVL